MRKKKVNDSSDVKELFDKAFNHSLFFLKFRPRSEKELVDNLIKYLHKLKIPENIEEEIVNKVVIRLRELNYLNDRDFVQYWLEKRFKGNSEAYIMNF